MEFPPLNVAADSLGRSIQDIADYPSLRALAASVGDDITVACIGYDKYVSFMIFLHLSRARI
jgi:hypothetical protein